MKKAYYHLPGLFEFYELYRVFLPLFYEHREMFYDWCEIGSIYGAPADCIWGGGRVGFGENNPKEVLQLLRQYGISGRLTFSNSLVKEEHLEDRLCNRLCEMFEKSSSEVEGKTGEGHGVIIHSEQLLSYLRKKYPGLYFVSSTTKVITDSEEFMKELNREEFRYVVADFRFNKSDELLCSLTTQQKEKVEFLCNECCAWNCQARTACYENVSRKTLGEDCEEHHCFRNGEVYRFSEAMKNPGFIGIKDITERLLPMGFWQYKIEGRSLGSAVILEMLLYYMVKPEWHLKVREEVYLDSMLDLF